jgi:hypothetical protein
MSVFESVKNIALEELAAKGYAPNPADVHGICSRVEMLVEHLIDEALAQSKPTQPTVQPTVAPQPAIQGAANPPTP